MCNHRAFQKHWNHQQANKFSSWGGHSRRRAWKEHFKAMYNQPAANVKELDDKYELHLFAPGFEKKDFSIAVEDKTLSISVAEKTAEEGNWQRQEYIPSGFVRKFGLNKKIDHTAITAKYINGVLILTLPKLEGFQTKQQEITVA